MKMTLHRALAELKLLDARIEKQISELIPVGIRQKDKSIGHVTPTDFSSAAKAKAESINDLITRKTLIKTAIVAANAVTTLKIGEKEMTIADAINQKNVMGLKKTYVNHLKLQYRATVAALNKNNEKVEENLQKILEATFGKDSTKVNPEDMAAVKKPYMDMNQYELYDPLNIVANIESLEKEIASFEMEVDAALSETNAITLIEV